MCAAALVHLPAVRAVVSVMDAPEPARALALALVPPSLVSALVLVTSNAAFLEATLAVRTAEPTMVDPESCCVSGGNPGGPSCRTNDGRSGTCKSTSTCSGTSVPGLCPGASNIQCCVTGDTPKPPSGPFDANKVIAAARRRIGLPYSWGGGHGPQPGPTYGTCQGYSGPRPCLAPKTLGLDCSGLVRDAIFAGTGIDLGRAGNTDSQLADRRATVINYSQRQPGDIEFFGPRGATTHVILYIGKNSAGQDMMIEAKQTGTNIHEVRLRTGGIWVRVR
ncbi:hypothetical protein BGZ72_008587 [Mortierella alpina]|nr:hypothetical protein BGZ72_008587 [Mortierella alpina]